MKRNEIDLSFIISGFEDVTHDEITGLLGIQPTAARVKGQKRNPANLRSPMIEINTWRIDSGINIYSNFDDHLNALLDIIEPKIDVLKPICQKYNCEISCGMFIYFDNGESTPWVHFDSRYNKLISQLNIEFDLDLYVFPV